MTDTAAKVRGSKQMQHTRLSTWAAERHEAVELAIVEMSFRSQSTRLFPSSVHRSRVSLLSLPLKPPVKANNLNRSRRRCTFQAKTKSPCFLVATTGNSIDTHSRGSFRKPPLRSSGHQQRNEERANGVSTGTTNKSNMQMHPRVRCNFSRRRKKKTK